MRSWWFFIKFRKHLAMLDTQLQSLTVTSLRPHWKHFLYVCTHHSEKPEFWLLFAVIWFWKNKNYVFKFKEADLIDVLLKLCFYLKFEFRWLFLMFMLQETKILQKHFGKTLKLDHGSTETIHDTDKNLLNVLFKITLHKK